MFIPDEQLNDETSPLAYLLTIWLIKNDSPEKRENALLHISRDTGQHYSLEKYPDEQLRKAVVEKLFDLIQSFGYKLHLLKVGGKKIKMIVDAPADTERILNNSILLIIETLRKTPQFSEKINLWEPHKKVENLWNAQQLRAAVQKIQSEN